MVEPAPKQEFIIWPLHVTVVPWFAVHDEGKLDHVLEEISTEHQIFIAHVGKTAMFGAKKDLPVNLLEESNDLISLHSAVYNSLELNGFYIHQKDYIGTKYQPHITHQGKKHMNEGDEFIVESFSLVKQVRQKKTGTMIKQVAKEYFLQ